MKTVRRESCVEVDSVLRTLRNLMKKQRLTYSELATALNVSESSVKRTFSQQKLDLDKISSICRVLGASFFDVMKLASENQLYVHQYTDKQDELLGKSVAHHYVFVRLLAGFSARDIQLQLNLSEREHFRLLRDLDKVGLIDLLPQNRVVLKVRPPFRLVPRGAMEKIARAQLYKAVVTRAQSMIHERSSERALLHYRGFYLTRESFEELKKSLLDLSFVFHQRVLSEVARNETKDLVPVTALLFVDEFNCMGHLYDEQKRRHDNQ